MKAKRTGQDVLKQLHALMQLAQSHPGWVETAAHGMTPEQLRKAHEGLSVLMHCVGGLPVVPAGTVASTSPASPAKSGKPRHEPVSESG